MLLSLIRLWFRIRFRGFDDSVIDHPFVSRMVFYPRKQNFPETSEFEKLSFKMDDNVVLSGFYKKISPDTPTILLFHGNGEIINDYYYYHSIYTSTGYNLAVVDYRGYGESEGTPFFSSLFSYNPPYLSFRP